MTFFTQTEYTTKYGDTYTPTEAQIEEASEKIYSQIGLRYRGVWDTSNVPDAIKRASMEQCKFMYEYEIPNIDYKDKLSVGEMSSTLSSHYSTYALEILGNAGFLNRGVPINENMKMELPF